MTNMLQQFCDMEQHIKITEAYAQNKMLLDLILPENNMHITL
jgi:hypothetical protein